MRAAASPARVLALRTSRVAVEVLVGTAAFVLVYELALRAPPMFDFHTFWQAARDYLHHRDPYPRRIEGSGGNWFVYPAPVAAVLAPFGALPFHVAASLFVVLLVMAVAAALWLLDVRDWRCYALAFCCLPVLKAVDLGTITPLLMLGVAGMWRLRDRRWPLVAVAAAVAVAKLFLWPLLAWLFFTGRRRQAAEAAGVAISVSLIAWAPVGLASVARYPSLLHQLSTAEAWTGFGAAGVAASAGVSPADAALTATLVAPAAVLLVWLAADRLPPRRSLAISVAVALLASPIVWMHYFALAVVCTALASPAMSAAWLLPLAYWATTDQQAWASLWRIALAAAVLVGSALWGTREAASFARRSAGIGRLAEGVGGSVRRVADASEPAA